jgi:hypothetical protein
VMLEQRQRHDQRQQPLPVVLDEAQQLQPALGRRCPHWTGDSSGGPSGAGARSAWARSLDDKTVHSQRAREKQSLLKVSG